MDDDKNLLGKTTDAVSSAAQSVTDGLKIAGKAVVEAVAPKPIRAGDNIIIPSTDPSMPPVVMPVKKRRRKSSKKAAARRPAGRKPVEKRRPNASARKTVKRPASRASKKKATKQARR